MADFDALGGKRPMSREQISRRTVSRDELARWTNETAREEFSYSHYWEAPEKIQISKAGDEFLVFVGRNEVMTAKIWTFLDHRIPHYAYILRPDLSTRYDLSEKEGIMLRFRFTGEVRIFDKDGVTGIIDEHEISVYQKADDVIVRVDRGKQLH